MMMMMMTMMMMMVMVTMMMSMVRMRIVIMIMVMMVTMVVMMMRTRSKSSAKELSLLTQEIEIYQTRDLMLVLNMGTQCKLCNTHANCATSFHTVTDVATTVKEGVCHGCGVARVRQSARCRQPAAL